MTVEFEGDGDTNPNTVTEKPTISEKPVITNNNTENATNTNHTRTWAPASKNSTDDAKNDTKNTFTNDEFWTKVQPVTGYLLKQERDSLVTGYIVDK